MSNGVVLAPMAQSTKLMLDGFVHIAVLSNMMVRQLLRVQL